MSLRCASQVEHGGSAPATPGFSAVAPEWPRCFAIGGCAPKPLHVKRNYLRIGRRAARLPAIPAAESTLGSHPCVALSSARVFPEWTTIASPCNDFSLNGDNPLNFVSHSRGSLHWLHYRGSARTHETCSVHSRRRASCSFVFPAWPLAMEARDVWPWISAAVLLDGCTQITTPRLPPRDHRLGFPVPVAPWL
jgi:hypothetical protein